MMTKVDKDNVEAVRHIMATLYSAQNALRSLAPEFRWAGMGNLLGDYGEFLAIHHYGLRARANTNSFTMESTDDHVISKKSNGFWKQVIHYWSFDINDYLDPITLNIAFVCQKCGECCKKVHGVISVNEASSIMEYLGMDSEKKSDQLTFFNKYLFITNGEKGVYGYYLLNGDRTIFNCNSIYCEDIKDTSGAGDIFFGIMLSELLLKKEPIDKNNFLHKVNLAQSLASLNCTLYGARSLQKMFLNQKFSPNEIFTTAKIILNQKKSTNSFSPRIGLSKPVSKPYRLAKLKGCDICGQLNIYKKKINKKAKIPPPRINKSLTRTPWTMRNSFEIGKTHRKYFSHDDLSELIFIGSGGSYSASKFCESLLLHSRGIISRALTPYEFEGLEKVNEKCNIWLISHGGGNTDVLGAALHVKKLHLKNVYVLTGNKNSKLAELARVNNWKLFFIQAEERNFVSIIGFLSQISTLSGIFATEEELTELNLFLMRNISIRYFSPLGEKWKE